MKKCNVNKSIIAAVFLLLSMVLKADTDPEVIGIVFSVKGDMFLKNADKEEEIAPGTKIYRSSIISLSQGNQKGKIQIITSGGPMVYSKFPVTFAKTTFLSLSSKQQENYIQGIGGTVLTSRAKDMSGLSEWGYEEEVSTSNLLFDWQMSLGVLSPDDIKKGFSLVLSRDKSSKENLSLFPLYFLLKQKDGISKITFEIIKDKTYVTLFENGKLKNNKGDFIFSFDSFPYETDTPYIAEAAITYEDGEKDYWDFSFMIAGNGKIKEIEDEALQSLSKGESNFDKAMIRARVYVKHNMKLHAMILLKDAGFDIEDMF